MAIVTGDRYLDLLSKFIESNTGALVDGVLLLKLNPVGLYYVQSRLEALEELETLRVGAPVDYLRAYVADLGDHRALEQVRRVLRLLLSAKVVSKLTFPARDPTPISLLHFKRLRSLELRGCDLSTSAARGLLELRPILEKLICHNSADALRHIFAERTVEIQDAQVWSRLANVSCYGNEMLLMDESLQLLPVVEALDLSRNRFAKVANLQKCLRLTFLDIGFNHITTVSNLSQILLNVKNLVLRNNALVSTAGIETIHSLEALDLSHNIVSNFREVQSLSGLPALKQLWLEGNPIALSSGFRVETFSFFSNPEKITLDGKKITMRERWVVKGIVYSRGKRTANAFTPAQTLMVVDSKVDRSVSGDFSESHSDNSAGPSTKSRRKGSRVACIEDELAVLSSSKPDNQQEIPYNMQASDAETGVQLMTETKDHIETTVLDLMHQTERLKREGANLWLRDLTDLLEYDVMKPTSSEDKGTDIHHSKLYLSKSLSKKRKKRVKELSGMPSTSSVYRGEVGEDVSQSGDENSISSNHEGLDGIEEIKDSPRGNESDSNSEQSYDNGGSVLPRAISVNDNQLLGVHSSGTIEDDSRLVHNYGAFKLTKELVTGKMSVGYPSSPPQFNHDLLYRRYSLERELMQLPLDPGRVPIYDSDTSSDDSVGGFSDSSESVQYSPRSFGSRSQCQLPIAGQFPERSNSQQLSVTKAVVESDVDKVLLQSHIPELVADNGQSTISDIGDLDNHCKPSSVDSSNAGAENTDNKAQNPKSKHVRRVVFLKPPGLPTEDVDTEFC